MERDLGSLTEVSKIVGISTDQLHQFLSVEKLSPEVKKLVEERKIDLINAVHYMRNFDYEAQKVIANEIINRRLTAGDLRVIAPLRKYPDYRNVTDLISRVRNAKNVKLYVLYFHVSSGLKYGKKLKEIFENIVGKNEVSSFKIEGNTGILEVTAIGKAKLREESRKRNLSLKDFVDQIIKKC